MDLQRAEFHTLISRGDRAVAQCCRANQFQHSQVGTREWHTADRMLEIESKVDQLQNSCKYEPSRDSFQKLAVVGFDPQISFEHRLVAMQSFMETNFPHVDARYTVVHSGSWKEKRVHRKMTSVGVNRCRQPRSP